MHVGEIPAPGGAPVGPSAAVLPRTHALCLGLALFALYLLTNSFTFKVGGDESILFGTVDSLVKRGGWEVDQVASIYKGDPDGESLDWNYGYFGLDGRQYGKSGLGHVLLLAPLEWIALQIPGLGLVNVTMLFSPLVTAATAVLLAMIAARLGYPPGVAVAVGLLYGIATFAWVYTKSLFPEPPSALALVLALWFLMELDRRPMARHVFALGVVLGLGFWIKGTSLAVLPIAMAFVAWRLWRGGERFRNWVFCVAAGGIPLALAALIWAWFNLYRFGDPMQAGYNFGFTNPLFEGLWGLLVSPGKGFFWYSPLLLAALAASPAFIRRHGLLAWLILAFALVQLPVYATWRVWTGGWAWGPRFLLPAVPFVALMLLPLLAWWGRRGAGWGGRGLAVLTGLSVALQLEGLAAHYTLYFIEMIPVDRVANTVLVHQLWATPLLGQLKYLQPATLDFAWLRVDDEGELLIGWTILAPLLVATLASFVALALVARGGEPEMATNAKEGERLIRRATFPAAIAVLSLAIVLGCTVWTLRAMHQAEDPQYRRLAETLAAQRGADGYVFSNFAREASFFNLNRSALPGLGLPDAPRLSKRAGLLLEAFDARTTHPDDDDDARLVLQVAQARPGDADTAVERWLAGRAYPMEPLWFGTLRLNRYLFLAARTPITTTKLEARFGDGMELEQFSLAAPLEHDGVRQVPVSLRWKRGDEMDESYRVALQIVDIRGALIAQSEGLPAGGNYPTSAWRKDETVKDNRLLTLPSVPLPDEYLLVLSVTDPRTGERLRTRDVEEGLERNLAVLARLRLE